MTRKIIKVVVTNDLHTDQRVHKVCVSLKKYGFEPHLTGILRPFSQPIKRTYLTDRFKMYFQKTALFYAEYNVKLFFKLLFGKYDIVLSNDTDPEGEIQQAAFQAGLCGTNGPRQSFCFEFGVR